MNRRRNHEQEQKDEEKKVFDIFCELSELPSCKFQHSSPDFISLNKELCVELTEYHLDADRNNEKRLSLRDSEAVAKRLINEAQRKYEQESGVKLKIYFSVIRESFGLNLAKKKQNCVVEKIVAVVKENDRKEVEIERLELPPELQPYVYSVHIGSIAEYEAESHWQIVEAGILDVRVGAVKKIIRNKESKLARYKNSAQEVWLLIHSSRMPSIGSRDSAGRFSSFGMVTNEMLETVFESRFDRVYYLCPGHSETSGPPLHLASAQKSYILKGQYLLIELFSRRGQVSG